MTVKGVYRGGVSESKVRKGKVRKGEVRKGKVRKGKVSKGKVVAGLPRVMVRIWRDIKSRLNYYSQLATRNSQLTTTYYAYQTTIEYRRLWSSGLMGER